jgi:phage head maturation protease
MKISKEEKIKMEQYDFGGWATRNDLLCGDGRIIRKDAFKDNDGQTVPLIWNHDHNNQEAVLGHALLENRDEGVFAHCKFNDTEAGEHAKTLVQNGDIRSLSIYANRLKQIGKDVVHGAIRELSLVLAGANPGASIEYVMAHNEEDGEGLIVNYDENAITIYHSDTSTKDKEDKTVADEKKTEGTESKKTIKEIIDSMTEEQQEAVYVLVGMARKDAETNDNEDEDEDDSEGGNTTMKHNVFDQDEREMDNVLTHSDQQSILNLAKQSNVGSLKLAMEMYAAEHGKEDSLAHGFDTDALEALLPEYELQTPGAPEILRADQTWVMKVINKIHKSPYSRVRTRQADATIADLKAKGYQNKGDYKKLTENIKLIGRSFDPQTIYIKDEMHRDDITDIKDFDPVAYIWSLMKDNMYETLALAALIGDGRDVTDSDKIKEDHICPIWHDNELYTMHRDVDIEAARKELQGTNTGANYGENYIYAEAIITAALYAREKFKGTGRPDFYCDPHLVNVMLLARDLNGRRIYDSKADLAKALNVGEIFEIEQFAGKTRTTEEGETKKLLGLFVNLADYQFGSTKGGEVTKFEDFDINFNKHQYLMETRLSGALTKLYSAIALEEPVNAD